MGLRESEVTPERSETKDRGKKKGTSSNEIVTEGTVVYGGGGGGGSESLFLRPRDLGTGWVLRKEKKGESDEL